MQCGLLRQPTGIQRGTAKGKDTFRRLCRFSETPKWASERSRDLGAAVGRVSRKCIQFRMEAGMRVTGTGYGAIWICPLHMVEVGPMSRSGERAFHIVRNRDSVEIQ